MHPDLAPEKLLAAYAGGIFPMADEEGGLQWLAPDPRAIIELECFKASRSLRAVCRRGQFKVTINDAFDAVLHACADRPEGTWISRDVAEAYGILHRLGFAHSVETWHKGQLAGGLYGVALGGVFFGESMFHRVTDASKVALVQLIGHMIDRDYRLLDVQFMTDHLRQFGAAEIPREEYELRLQQSLHISCSFVGTPRMKEADG